MLACRLTLRNSHLSSQARFPASVPGLGAVRTFFTIIKGAPSARHAYGRGRAPRAGANTGGVS